MGSLLFVVLLIVVVGVGVTVLKGKVGKDEGGGTIGSGISPSNLQAKAVLTEREQPMYWRLVEAFPEHVVLSQVSFSQLVSAKGGNRSQNLQLFRRISQKTADFVLCRKDFSVIAVIELDDSSHKGKETKDAERDGFLKQAGIKTLRVKQPPPVELLRQAFASKASAEQVVKHEAKASP